MERLPERDLSHLYSSAEPEPCPSCGERVSEDDPTQDGRLIHLFCADFRDVASAIDVHLDLARVEEATAIARMLAEDGERKVTKMREMRELRRRLGVCEFCRGSRKVQVEETLGCRTWVSCSCSKEAQS